MNLEECLPADLRGPATTITPIAAGLSGAGVYRVEAAGRSLVLKVAPDSESPADWQRTLGIQRLAAGAGISPAIVHVDESRRAVLTAFVADRSFARYYRDPSSHEAALTLLARTVRRIHALPIAEGASASDPRALLGRLFASLRADFQLPDFAVQAIERVLAEAQPESERPAVTSHCDLNPSNLVYDGESLLLLDWAAAGPMDPYFDLSVLAVFLRMDEGTCLRLLSAYEDRFVGALPARFTYLRRLVAALAGTMQLSLARQHGHKGATGRESPATTLSLPEFYQGLMSGAIQLATADGQWAFGLALLKTLVA